MFFLFSILIFTFSTPTYAVAPAPPTQTAQSFEIENQETFMQARSQILKLTKSISRCKVDEDCQATGLGHRSCGGFEEYIVHSKELKNHKTALKLIEKYNTYSKKRSEKFVGVCVYTPAPGVACIQKECRAQVPGTRVM